MRDFTLDNLTDIVLQECGTKTLSPRGPGHRRRQVGCVADRRQRRLQGQT